MYNIVIIGIGNIRRRHFQALLNCNEKLNIFLVDTSEDSLNMAKEMLLNTIDSYVHNIQMIKEINELPNEVEVAIIATSSSIRSKIIKELLTESRKLKYLILEKVLFQTIKEYDEIGKLLSKKNVQTWVNCPRRMMEGHKEIKRRLEKDNVNNIVISGGNWGLGCNSIHMLDLICFFVGEISTLTINSNMLDAEITKSKRSGYYEFTGSLFGELNQNIKFIITSNKNNTEPIIMYFMCDNSNIIIRENENVADVIVKGVFEKIEVPINYQSELTNIVVEQLIRYGKCELTTFDTSSKIHLPLINAFLNHQQIYEKRDDKICRIT